MIQLYCNPNAREQYSYLDHNSETSPSDSFYKAVSVLCSERQPDCIEENISILKALHCA